MNELFASWLTAEENGLLHFHKGSTLYIFIRVAKGAGFDYLYCQRHYNAERFTRGDSFKYAGIYYSQDSLIYDGQYDLREVCDEDSTESRTVEALRERLKKAVRQRIEAAIGNDRNNLKVAEITDKRLLDSLDYFYKYTAKQNARSTYLDNMEVEESAFQCRYSPDNWTEESLLSYISDPDGYVEKEASAYMAENQENMLSDFLENDAILSEYRALLENKKNPVHRVKKIIAAVGASGAKTVNVTICKDGTEFSFKTEASDLRRDCDSYYHSWHIVAADRREFERIFGRNADYRPEHIIRIMYGKKVLYEADE